MFYLSKVSYRAKASLQEKEENEKRKNYERQLLGEQTRAQNIDSVPHDTSAEMYTRTETIIDIDLAVNILI